MWLRSRYIRAATAAAVIASVCPIPPNVFAGFVRTSAPAPILLNAAVILPALVITLLIVRLAPALVTLIEAPVIPIADQVGELLWDAPETTPDADDRRDGDDEPAGARAST